MATRLGAPTTSWRSGMPVRLTSGARADLTAAKALLEALLRDAGGPTIVPARPAPAPPAPRGSADPLRPIEQRIGVALAIGKAVDLDDRLALMAWDVEACVLVPSVEIADAARRAATWMAKRCAAELGVRLPPRVSWYATAGSLAWSKAVCAGRPDVVLGPTGCRGFYAPRRPGAIHVRVTEDAREAAEAVAHELRHRQQHATRGAVVEQASAEVRDQLEEDAAAFARHMLADYDAGGLDD